MRPLISRVSRAGARAFAPARFARLIARIREANAGRSSPVGSRHGSCTPFALRNRKRRPRKPPLCLHSITLSPVSSPGRAAPRISSPRLPTVCTHLISACIRCARWPGYAALRAPNRHPREGGGPSLARDAAATGGEQTEPPAAALKTEAGPRLGGRGDGRGHAVRSHRKQMCESSSSACGERPGGGATVACTQQLRGFSSTAETGLAPAAAPFMMGSRLGGGIVGAMLQRMEGKRGL